MKKVTNVSLGGMSFQVEDDAYARLENYLADIRARFSQYAGADEIVQDIEARAAEQLGGMDRKIVTLLDVELLIAQLGSPEELGGEDEPVQEKRKAGGMKRLFRNPDDAIVAGVASGMAAWIGVAAKWIRLALVIAVALTAFTPINFLGIVSLIAYVILWATLPVASTETERMEMRGEPVTLENLESALKERVSAMGEDVRKAGTKARVTGGIAAIAAGVAKVATAAFTIGIRVVGVIVAAVGIAVVAAAVIAVANVLINGIHPAIRIGSPDVPLNELFSGWARIVGVVALGLAVAIPAAFAFMLGASIARMRTLFTNRMTLSLLGVWLVAVTTVSVIGVRTGGALQDRLRGDRWREEAETAYDLKGFRKVAVSGGYDVEVRSGSAYKVEARGSRASIEGAKVIVNGGTLTVGQADGDPFAALKDTVCLFCDTRDVSFVITLPALEDVSATGGSYVNLEDVSATTLRVSASGDSAVRGALDVTALAIDANEGSSIDLIGSADNAAVTGTRDSWIDLQGSDIGVVAIELSEGSSLQLGSVRALTVRARTGSSVTYDQADDISREELSGGSSLRHRNQEE